MATPLEHDTPEMSPQEWQGALGDKVEGVFTMPGTLPENVIFYLVATIGDPGPDGGTDMSLTAAMAQNALEAQLELLMAVEDAVQSMLEAVRERIANRFIPDGADDH